MNRIIEINPEEGWVRVEAGVQYQLNQYLEPFGYFFAPELLTSNRQTLRTINTMHPVRDRWSTAKRQITYLAYVRYCWGAIFSIRNLYPVELAETLGKSNTTIGRIYNTVYQRCRQQRQLIIDNFPKLNRFLTGYDLRHVFNDEMTEFDLTRILMSSEGTLAFITEARLDITRLPKVRRLVNWHIIFYLRCGNAPFMVEARAFGRDGGLKSAESGAGRYCLAFRQRVDYRCA
ncbi:FAD-binding oxidoreductase [Escherichia coli]